MTSSTPSLAASTLFKTLDKNGRACHGGNGQWFLPNGRAGKWMPKIPSPVPCSRGYHLVRGPQVLSWLHDSLWIAEARGEIVEQSDKICVEQARLVAPVHGWNDTSARLFAADCAEHVLYLFEQERPDDDRPRKAIEAAREYARGEIGAAARDAAGAAAWDAAGAAAGAAAWAAARDAAGAAARAAARDAAGDAAGAAARDAAWDAETEWQFTRLLSYLNGATA